MAEALTSAEAETLLGCTGVLIFAALLIAGVAVAKKGTSVLFARKPSTSSQPPDYISGDKQLSGGTTDGAVLEKKEDEDMVLKEDSTELTATSTSSNETIPSKSSFSMNLPPEFVLPFHLSLFQDVTFLRQFLCVLWICSFGPILLVLRVVLCAAIFALQGPSAFDEKWLFSGLLGWKVKTICDNDLLPEDGRPVVFLANHHITYDAGMVRHAVIDRFGFACKIFVHPKVYNSVVLKNTLGSGIGEILATSPNKSTKFLDMFRDWVKEHKKSTAEAADKTVRREAMVIAPAGMTTHSGYQTPMYWEYFAEKDAVKVLVDISVTNLFGVNLRALSGGSILNELFTLMMPWLSATVTLYTEAIPDADGDGLVTSQPEVDEIVADMCLKHNKTFAAGWTQKMRRNIDKYLVNEEFTTFPASGGGASATDSLKLIDFDGDIPLELKARLPKQTAVVTSSLVGNRELHELDGLQVSGIALINPRTIEDEILASVYSIPLAKSECTPLDAYEAKWSMWVQRVFDLSILNFLGMVLHYIVLEKNFILFATLAFASGKWRSEILLLAQMVTLGQIWLLFLKGVVRRIRPVWLPSHFPLKSMVQDIQVDGSFPSGHTCFLTLLAATAFQESGKFSVTSRAIFTVLTVLTGLERVKLGAHFVSDVVAGAAYAAAFVSIFYAAGGNEKLLYRTSHLDLDFQVGFTIALVAVEIFVVLCLSIFQKHTSALHRSTYLWNNQQRLAPENREEYREKPLGKSLDHIAPFVGLSATVFWMQPLLTDIYARNTFVPPKTDEINGGTRFLGSLTLLAFMIVIIMPLRKLTTTKLQSNPLTRFFALAMVYAVMLIFTGLYCFFVIQAVAILQDN